MTPRNIVLRSAAALVAMIGIDLALAHLTLADGLFLGRPFAPFDPPLFSPSQFEALERIERELSDAGARPGKFDPELGWCNKPLSGFGEFRYDWAGARMGAAPLGREKTPGVRRVVAIGCSMTHGEEVGAEESWCARVDALRPDLEVVNLGVAAFGIDQALLRLRRDGLALTPDEVWLGILPSAALRVTTLFRPLLDHWSLDIAFKPRFELDSRGELALVPCPVASLAAIPRLLRDQREFLEHVGLRDPWVRRAPGAYAPRGSSWTHRFFTTRLVATVHERRGRDLAACFDDESEFGRIYTEIVRSAARECEQRGLLLRVLILPGEADLLARERSGRGIWERWAERRRAEGMAIVDLAPALASGGELARLYAPGGHFTSETSERVALALLERIAP
jgi:hypothetical protein